jgi:hypothetical protein
VTPRPRPQIVTGVPLTRRALLALGGALIVPGCDPTDGDGEAVPSSRSVSHMPPRPVVPRVRPWRPDGNEIEPRAKLAAARAVEALGTAPVASPARRRLADAGASPALAGQAGPLLPPAEPAVVDLLYPQYGGLTDTSACVITVAEQSWLADARVRHRTVTVDVRLRRDAAGWRVSALYPVEPIGRPLALSGSAAELARRSAVDLPDAALVDLARGVVDRRVIDALLDLSETFEMSVSVFRSGHPTDVFGTDRTSNHARGRAVDIWAINGRPVVTMGDDRTLVDFLTSAARSGSDEIGGPIVPDRAGGAYFTDAVHHDHVHIGFDS